MRTARHLSPDGSGPTQALLAAQQEWKGRVTLVSEHSRTIGGRAVRVLVVADDVGYRDKFVIPFLARSGFEASGVELIRDLFRNMIEGPPDIVLMDAYLPDGDGFAAAMWLRDHFPQTALVLLGGEDGTCQHVQGLTAGADAFLSKPVQVDLLQATLESVVRRLGRSTVGSRRMDKWHLDASGWCLVSPGGERIPLTKTERRVVARLVTAKGSVVSRDQLIESLTDDAFNFDPHRLDSLIHRMRRKVLRAAGVALPLTAVHGQGYVMAD